MNRLQILIRNVFFFCLLLSLGTFSCTAKKVVVEQEAPKVVEIEEIERPIEEIVEEEPMVMPSAPEVEYAPPPPPPPPPPAEREVFKVVEEMPRFPGCEGQSLSKTELKACAQEKMVAFIYKNLEYPPVALENGIEGICVVTFAVIEDGTLSNIRLVRDIGAGCGQEALRLVNLMNEREIVWRPGFQRGRPVQVQFNLPVKFVLPSGD